LIGQKEFNEQLAFFKNHLKTLRLNQQTMYNPTFSNSVSSQLIQIPNDSSTQVITHKPSPAPLRSFTLNLNRSLNDSQSQPLPLQQTNDDKDEHEFDDSTARKDGANVYEQNLDYLNRDVNDHNDDDHHNDLNDGQANLNLIDKPFLVTKTVSHRGRSRGAAAPFGFFAGRVGRTGNATRSRSANSAENVVSTSNSLARPKSGPGSRGEAGAYNKSKKIKRNETENDDKNINTNPPRALSPISLHSDSSENSPIRKPTIRIKKKHNVISDDESKNNV